MLQLRAVILKVMKNTKGFKVRVHLVQVLLANAQQCLR